MGGCKLALCAGAALLLLAGCERASAVADRSEPARAEDQAPRRFASVDRSQDRADEASDHRGDPVPQLDGKPMWSASRRYSPEESAQRAFERNGEAFAARDVDDYVRKAHAFVEDPPKGTLTLARSNGDVLFYDPKANVFAVANKDGAPRTMFKPREGAAYWDEQKTREASRQAARSDRKARDADEG